MFDQVLNPFGSVFAVWLAALIPVVVLLFLLAGLRMTAWLATLIGSIVLGIVVWGMPVRLGLGAYVFGSMTGIWAVDWITFWGVVLFNTLVLTGPFESFRAWLTTPPLGEPWGRGQVQERLYSP